MIMGAEAVVETGGILNKLGSLQIGVLAKTFNVPVYIATGIEYYEYDHLETYKFTRMYPLSQKSVPVDETDKTIIAKSRPEDLNEGVEYAAARCDYLPPEYITLLMTGRKWYIPSI